MSNKLIIAFLSIVTIFFLTAQTCSLPTTSTGLAADCVGEGNIVCDDTEAYECGLAAYGTGYYVSRASEYDVSECGATEEFNEETLARKLITLSSDLEAVIDDLNDLKMEGRNAEADGDGRALLAIRSELREVRTTLAEISSVLDAVIADVDAAALAGEDTTALDSLVTEAETALTVAEDLLLVVSTQVSDALTALRSATLVSASCSVSTTTAAVGETITFDASGSSGAATYSWDFDADGLEDSTSVVDTYDYSTTGTYTAALTVTASDGTTDSVSCDTITMSACLETDSGSDWTTQGITTGTYYGTFGSYDDVCFGDGGTDLSEYYCSGSDVLRVTKDCSYVDASYLCFDGACTTAPVGTSCSADSDCNDNYACDLTTETCYTYCDFGNAECALGYACSRTSSTNDGCQVDTDGDALPDDREAVYGSDETDTDTDDDGLTDYEEVIVGTSSPVLADSDEDGLNDGIETLLGFSPEDDDLSSYVLLNFDIDSHDWAAHDSDGDGYTDYYGSTSSGAEATGEVGYTNDGENYIVDLTSSTADEYIYFDALLVPSNVADWLVIKTSVKPGSSTSGTQPLVIHATSTCYKPQYVLDLYNGGYRLSMNVAGTMVRASGGTATSGSWQEIVAVYKDSMLYLFVDGTLVDSEATNGAPLVTSSKGLSVGYSDTTLSCANEYDFEGYIDTIQIWGE